MWGKEINRGDIMKKELEEMEKQTKQWLKDKDERGELMMDFISFMIWRKKVKPWLICALAWDRFNGA
uniref:Uncharacterized protein n=1 Tax=viral metagenome TaxID=1070528 RepID=A0A6M3KQ15_9ZZZZ